MLERDKDTLSRKLIFFSSFGCFVLFLLLFCPVVLLCVFVLRLVDGATLKANCTNFTIFSFCWLYFWLDFLRPISTLDSIRVFVVIIIKQEELARIILAIWMAIAFVLFNFEMGLCIVTGMLFGLLLLAELETNPAVWKQYRLC